jgi:RHS repeat-associated protein
MTRIFGTIVLVRTLCLCALLVCIVGVYAPPVTAQGDPLEAVGIRPVSTHLPIQNGYIDLANQDVHIEIPLGSFVQRNGRTVNFSLMYDSAIWSQGGVGWSSPWINSVPWHYGWRLVSTADPGSPSFTVSQSDYCTLDHTYGIYTTRNYSWSSTDGTAHIFPTLEVQIGIQNKCGSHQTTYGSAWAGDASGYFMTVAATGITVYSPGGDIVYTSDTTVIPGASTVYPANSDSNGNYFLTDSSGVVYGLYDTLGRLPVVTSGPGGSASTISVLNSQGTSSTYTITNETINVWTDFAAAGSGLPEYQGSGPVIQSIALPDGTSYSFGYDSGTTQGHYGQLTSMTLPTGGTISFAYETFDDSEYNTFGKHVTRGVSSMTTPDGIWAFTPQVVIQCSSGAGQYCEQSVQVSEPSGDNSVYTFEVNPGAWPIEIQNYTGSVSSANLLASVAQSFDFSRGSNVTITSSTLTLPLPGGTTINRTTKFAYDTSYNNGNLLTKSEWNFYTGSLPTTADRTTTYAYLNSTPYFNARIIDHPSSITVTDKSGNTVAQTLNWYDQTSLAPMGGIVHHNDSSYGTGNTVRGNLTEVQNLVSGTSNYLNIFKTYDITGQVSTSTDSNGNITMYSCSDNFFTDIGNTSTPTAFSPPGPTNAYLTTVTQGALVTKFGYYWGKGQTALSIDPNSQTKYFHFYDSFDRPTSTIFPDNGWIYSVYPSGSEILIDTYTGITNSTLTTSCPPSGNSCRHDQEQLDGLGRNSTSVVVSDPISPVDVVTHYDSNGRIQQTSNRYRTTSDSSYGWTTPSYDGLNRTVQVQQADGSVTKTYYGANVSTAGGLTSQLCSSAYGLGYPVLGVDEASNKRQTWTDGFGRLIEVDEPNSTGTLSVGTCYSYDLNDNLTGVAQGTETRSFSYDLLSRLTLASNLEPGPINYYYTNSGSSLCSGDPNTVCRRTDSKLVTTTYSYDTLNRLTSKSYSDSTHAIAYSYDGSACIGTSPCYNKGRRTAMTDAAGSESWSYDKLGRMSGDKRTTNSITEQTTYAYNFDGSLSTLTYPSGRTITYLPNAAAQPISASDIPNGVTYATSGSYAPNGALMTLSNGTQFNSTYIYNPRLQSCWIYTTAAPSSLAPSTACSGSASVGTIVDLKYNFNAGSGDNGNVVTITNNRDTSRSQSFSYDPLNRLSTAQTGSTFATNPTNCWGELFGYDRWANLLSIGVSASGYIGCTQQTLSLLVNGQNQITSPTGYVYDADGNLATAPAPGAATYTYDAENEITSTAGVTYSYDGYGRRVEKSNGKLYWYGSSGEVLDETDLSGNLTSEYVFFGGKRVGRRDSPSNNVFFYFEDYLGSSRVTVQSGASSACYEADFFPFGGERTPLVNSCPQNYKFTGKERDTESGLDNFGARYYSSQFGRFMTPDPSGLSFADPSNPQGLNLYAYVLSNPMSLVDPSGLNVVPPLKCGLLNPCWLQPLADFFRNSDSGFGPPDGFVRDLWHSAQQLNGVTAQARGGGVTYTYPDGSKFILRGSHPFRDNNPGDLRSGHGSIGRDRGFAIYPSLDAGVQALGATLTGKYGNLTIAATMKAFAPKSDGNDPVKYAATLASAVGVPVSTKISALTPAQLMTFQYNIAIAEGYNSPGNTATYIAPQQ